MSSVGSRAGPNVSSAVSVDTVSSQIKWDRKWPKQALLEFGSQVEFQTPRGIGTWRKSQVALAVQGFYRLGWERVLLSDKWV